MVTLRGGIKKKLNFTAGDMIKNGWIIFELLFGILQIHTYTILHWFLKDINIHEILKYAIKYIKHKKSYYDCEQILLWTLKNFLSFYNLKSWVFFLFPPLRCYCIFQQRKKYCVHFPTEERNRFFMSFVVHANWKWNFDYTNSKVNRRKVKFIEML